ncbi:non-ribosomal peptide synthetase [Catenuloplanes indicus]|uniref:Amino acid adenylation domain-containing protein n=1 Tax=Catenuloplanes indicus TaxID=137267 RepID=A0AAE3W9X9_9ACTN|nr:non-ribosomal peptide synthetase [Catenuloplanes indicus]MDQ0371182.1 amino acid adenylation domain-containing protein [Catenuloplanes indicus]
MTELVQARVREYPERTALRDGDSEVTYGQLNARANRLAHWLRERGVGPERVVAVHLGRGAGYVTAALAVLKAGGAYLPIDPANPEARVAAMTAGTGAGLVLCGTEHAGRLRAAGVEPVSLDAIVLDGLPDDDPEPGPLPGDLAYVVHTSGSTGAPKGVMVTHGALAAFLASMGRAYDVRPADRLALVCSPSFDVSVSELWLPLAAGASIDVPPAETVVSPVAVVRWLADRGITMTVLPTPLAERALQERWPERSALRVLNTGGDRLHVRPSADHPFVMINNYGPTENTVISTFGVVRPSHGADPALPTIGRPVPGTTVELLDGELRPVADGETGEMYLGGDQLARGYAGRADLTADRFVPHPRPRYPGERLYRSGDLARRTGTGEIEFVGRGDDQVKLRGHRIELGEVVAALRSCPGVADAYVLPRRDGGEDRLIAYLAPADLRRVPAAAQLRAWLAERLPQYMIPAAFVVLESLPAGTNGKVDRAALPDPVFGAGPAATEAPRSATEKVIAAIWREVLHVARVGRTDSFVDLGGHSLMATQIVARVHEVLDAPVTVGDLFRAPRLDAFAHAVEQVRHSGRPGWLPALEPGSGPLVAPLSVPQEQVWFIGKLAPGNTAYHAQATIRVTGPFDTGVFAGVLTEIVRRHESLRTAFEEHDGRPRQTVLAPSAYPLRVVDLGGVPPAEREERLAEEIDAEMRRPFDLSRPPLSRWTVVRLGPDEHELIMVEHHFVHDGWSFSVLMREMEEIYGVLAGGGTPVAAPDRAQYRDFVAWQQDLIDSGRLRPQLEFWRHRLAGVTALPLPTDRPRPTTQTFRGRVLRLETSAGLARQIARLGRAEGVSRFMTMYAAFTALLHRYTGATDLCFASGFANRRLRELEDVIGMIVNPVALRLDVRPSESFRDLLARARDTVLEAAENQESPFPLVVRQLGLERDPSRNPLTQIMFSAHDSAVRNPRFGTATGTVFERSNSTSKVDLNIIVVPRAAGRLGAADYADERITVLWEYNSDLFDAATMHALADAYFRLLGAAVERPGTAITDLPVLSDTQLRALLVDDNAAERRAVPHTAPSVARLVEARAAADPGAVAVDDGERVLTYGELDAEANRLAGALRALGAGREDVIGVLLHRSCALPVAELAVLKSGAAFLPVDPAHPDERVRRILDDAGARALLTTTALAGRPCAADRAVIAVDAPPEAAPATAVRTGPDDLAYVIYTSGSTGRPKGVLIQQHSFANLVTWHAARFALGPADRTTGVASPGFDFSLWELWPTLVSGGSVHLPPDETLLSSPELRRWLVRQRITVTLLPTPLAEPLLDSPWPEPGSLRVLHAGGDRLTVRPPDGLGFEVFNTYGPTENTMISTTGPVAPRPADGTLPHIGTPIDGTGAYVLDGELNLVPEGAVGELYLAGVGLARGYLGRPDLTADRFVPHPFPAEPGQRLYRTGDLVRRLADGSLAFLGRADAQVQIRGHRIEPAEAAAALREHPSVGEVHVAADTDPDTGRTELVAWVTPVPGAAPPEAPVLRAYLGRVLPAYLVPGAYVVLGRLPLTRNGKLDRTALPRPRRDTAAGPAPAGETEGRLASIWAEVLKVDRVGADDNFFDLGGHSLLLAEVHRRIVTDLGRRPPLVSLLTHPTVRSLGRFLDSAAPEPADDPRPASRDRLRAQRSRRRPAEDGAR